VILRPAVREVLDRHHLEVRADDTPATLRDRLNDLYLVDVRRLRERQKAGEIALRDYAAHVRALHEGYRLLGLPLEMWTEPAEAPGR
jgi:hypothetical protein